MTEQEYKKLKSILDNTPEGATHCTDTTPSMNLYSKVEHLGGFYVRFSNRWQPYPIYAGVHLLSDIKKICSLYEQLQELTAKGVYNNVNEIRKHHNKIKADAIREALKNTGANPLHTDFFKIEKYAGKLEGGE